MRIQIQEVSHNADQCGSMQILNQVTLKTEIVQTHTCHQYPNALALIAPDSYGRLQKKRQ